MASSLSAGSAFSDFNGLRRSYAKKIAARLLEEGVVQPTQSALKR